VRPGPFGCLLAAAGALWTAGCAPPEQSGVVECIAPAGPGGGWDRACRTAGAALEELDLVPGSVRTINLLGAGGGIGFAHVVSDRATDPNVLAGASPATTLRLAQGQYGDLTEDDVRWLAAVGAEYGVLAVRADAPWATLEEFVAQWRNDPGSIVLNGVSAVLGQDHVKILLLARAAGIDPRAVRYVPFDGSGEAMTAVLGGFVDVYSGEESEVEPLVESGDLRALTVLAPERVDGILAVVPRGIGEDAYRTWVDRMTRMVASDRWDIALEQAGLRRYQMIGSEFEAFVEAQVESFRGLARDLGMIR
jgi:putative tricarboxylic transport membrane protein